LFDSPLYAGYFFDHETGLYQVRNRYYDAGLSVWTSRDPAESDMNLYRYVGDQPISGIDPTGLAEPLTREQRLEKYYKEYLAEGRPDRAAEVKFALDQLRGKDPVDEEHRREDRIIQRKMTNSFVHVYYYGTIHELGNIQLKNEFERASRDPLYASVYSDKFSPAVLPDFSKNYNGIIGSRFDVEKVKDREKEDSQAAMLVDFTITAPFFAVDAALAGVSESRLVLDDAYLGARSNFFRSSQAPVSGAEWNQVLRARYGSENVSWARVPTYTGGKTSGVLSTSVGEIDLLSGKAGPAASMPYGAVPGMNNTLRTHVEAHAASAMRQLKLPSGTLYLNRVPCEWGTRNGCKNMLPYMLGEGRNLRVIVPGEFDELFYGETP
jgi:RHS repeat-associated protein